MRVPSTEVQNSFGKYLKFAEAGEDIIVTKNGRDMAKLTAMQEADKVCEESALYETGGERVSYEEFLELVNQSDQRFELIDGVVYNLASPVYKHQHAVHELHGTFYNWFKGKPCTPLTSPFDVTFDQDPYNICVVQPDIVVICDKQNVNEKGQYRGIPTLVIEVLSPSTRSKDLLKKLHLYQRSGVQEYWVVDPLHEQVQIYVLTKQDIIDSIVYTKRADDDIESVVFDGLKASLIAIFTE